MNATIWTMPEWMEPYRQYLDPLCAGNTVEQLMNEASCTVQINAKRTLICIGVAAGVALLEALNEDGHLIP